MTIELKNFFRKNKKEEEKILPITTEKETDPEENNNETQEKLDGEVEQAIESLENKVEDITKLIDGVGGSEGIEKTLKEIDPEKTKEIKKRWKIV